MAWRVCVCLRAFGLGGCVGVWVCVCGWRGGVVLVVGVGVVLGWVGMGQFVCFILRRFVRVLRVPSFFDAALAAGSARLRGERVHSG